MNRALRQQNSTAEELLQPESTLEKELLAQPEFSMGLDWGTPRFGHPEGKVLFHVRDVLDNIDRLNLTCEEIRTKLRTIAFAHDTFKYKEGKARQPRDWSKHHAVLARKFMESYTSDSEILNIIQWHDEAYYCWRTAEAYHNPDEGERRFEKLLNKVSDHLSLYYQFFICDTRTGDKNQAPVRWLEERLEGIEPIRL